MNPFFNPLTLQPRAILIDTESKVVQKFRTSASFKIDPKNIVAGASGRANNWAYGYSQLDEPELDGRYDSLSLESLRREVEACDFYTGCFLFHSLAGGSGSGLGSRML